MADKIIYPFDTPTKMQLELIYSGLVRLDPDFRKSDDDVRYGLGPGYTVPGYAGSEFVFVASGSMSHNKRRDVVNEWWNRAPLWLRALYAAIEASRYVRQACSAVFVLRRIGGDSEQQTAIIDQLMGVESALVKSISGLPDIEQKMLAKLQRDQDQDEDPDEDDEDDE